MTRCPHYTDGQHRHDSPTGHLRGHCICGDSTVSLFDQVDPAPHRDRDPYPSHQAAERARPRARSQAAKILKALAQAGPTGASTRELQRALFAPADPAWNKVPTRLKLLATLGLAKRWTETRAEAGQHFLVYEITAAGTDAARDDQ